MLVYVSWSHIPRATRSAAPEKILYKFGLTSLSSDAKKVEYQIFPELFVNVGRTETEHSNIIDTSLVTTANDEVVFLNFTGAGNPITPTANGRTYLLITSN